MRTALLALVLVGCTNPDEIIAVSGTVLSIDPVEGQSVRMLRSYQPNGAPWQTVDGTLFKETQVDAGGKFGFEAFRIEAQSFGGFGDYAFRVETDFPSGSRAWSDFGLGMETRLAPLRDWRASPRLEGDVLRFDPPFPWPEPPLSWIDDRAQFTTTDGGVVWRAGDRPVSVPYMYEFPHNEPIVMDALRMEDFSGVVNLEATTAEFGGTVYDVRLVSTSTVELRSGEVLALTGSRVPLSRGLPCAGFDSPCPLTDADLTMVDAGFREELTLELPSAAVLSAVVLRGAEVASFDFTLELGQPDGGVISTQQSFPRWANVDGYRPPLLLADGGYAPVSIQYDVISLDAGVPVQRVTLRFPNGLLRIAEVSLFE